MLLLFNVLIILSLSSSFKINMMSSEKPSLLWNTLSSNLKKSARNWFINRAENSGIDWNHMVQRNKYKMHRLEYIKDQSTDYTMIYPDYYTQPFHGYDRGNLNWLAALEGEPATINMAVSYWKQNNPLLNQDWLRYNITNNIKDYLHTTSLIKDPYEILDVGCSIGISTEYLYKSFPNSKLFGIDLSPYFISMAKLRSEEFDFPIKYYHRNAEYTHFDDKRFGLVTCNFIFHECPEKATQNILQELHRKLIPGGTIAIADLSPRELNKDSFFLTKFRKWAFEVTEPHIYGYYIRDMKKMLSDAGFVNIKEVKNDPINSVWLASRH